MSRKPKSVKFYHPGIISLVLLPLVVVIYIYHDVFASKYFMTEIVWRTRSIENTSTMFGSDFYQNYKDTSYRHYRTIWINEPSDKTTIALSNASTLIKHLIAKKDTTNGLRIKFGSKANYEDLVDVINFCIINEEPNFRYYCIDDEIMAYYKLPEPVRSGEQNMSFICGLSGDSELVRIHDSSVAEGLKHISQNLTNSGFNKISTLLAAVAWFILFCVIAFKPVVNFVQFATSPFSKRKTLSTLSGISCW